MSSEPLIKPHSNGDDKPHGNGDGKPHGNGGGKPHGNGDGKPHGNGGGKPHGNGGGKPHGNGDGKPHGNGGGKPHGNGGGKPHGNGDGKPHGSGDSDSSGDEYGAVHTHRSSVTFRTSARRLSGPKDEPPSTSYVSAPLKLSRPWREGHTHIRNALVFKIACAALTLVSIILLIVVIHLVTSKPPVSYCQFKDGDHVKPRDLKNPDVFDDMTPDEYSTVQQFMLNDASLKLSPWNSATVDSSYIFSIELVLPNKGPAIQYLDKGKQMPERMAKVVVVRGNSVPPVVEEYIVSPLPKPTSVSSFKDPTFKRHPIPYVSRPIDLIDYKFLFPLVVDKLTEQLYPLLMESYGLCYHNCTEGVNCLHPYDVAPRGTKSGERTSYFWFFPPVDGFYVHPLGLEFLIDHKSTDVSQWKVVKIVYNGQQFDDADALMAAYNNKTLKLIHYRSHKESPVYSTYEPRDVPKKPVQGPKLTEPEGKRFDIHGQRVVYGKWSFHYHMRPTTGLMLFDVKFDGTRIAYEISLQEVLVMYTGYGPTQSMTQYYDVAWLLGASNMELARGVDCPDTAVLLDTYFMINSGNAELIKNNICVFENNGGMPLRRHYQNDFQGGYDFYGGVTDYHLIIRTMANVLNYDYVFDYIFYTNGAVEVKASATGFVQAAFRLPQEERYGSVIHDHVVADLHQHVFNYKVDLDIVGTSNRYTTLDVGVETIDNPWIKGEKRTQMKFTKKLIPKESNISTDVPHIPQYHLIHNKNAKNKYGEDRSYRIINKSPIVVMMANESIANAAKWTRYPIIVTQRKDAEQTSTSIYAQDDPWDPVHDFSDYISGESLVDEDLVAWVTIGTHHIPGTEDVPSTPTNWNQLSFFLSPHNYFEVCPSTSSADTVVIRPKGNGKTVVQTFGPTFKATCVPKASGPYDYDGRRILMKG